jgi:Skp family chaperone for outer membrane proteins
MKFIRPVLVTLLAAVLMAPLSAQTAPATLKPIAPVSVAYVNSGLFTESATGLKQLVRAMQSLELEFSGQQSELSLLSEKLRTLVSELQKLNANPEANAAAIAEKQTEGQAMQQDLQGKQQAAQQAYNARAQEVQGPVLEKIGAALREFSKQREIGMLFDISKMGDAVLDANPELDVTADFIGYFNSLNP